MPWPEHKLPEWVMAAIKRDEAIEDAERAVIEAARACVARHPMGPPPLSARSWLALVEAIQALDAAESGDEQKCPVCGDPEFRCHHDEDADAIFGKDVDDERR